MSDIKLNRCGDCSVKILRAAAQAYKVDTDAIALKVKHEFNAQEKARTAKKLSRSQ